MIALLFALAFAAPVQAASAPTPPAAAVAKRLSIDSRIAELIGDPRTAAVLKKRMPGFIEKTTEDEATYAMFSGVTLRELEHDPHVRGLTAAILERLDGELAAAQAPPAS